MKPECPFVQNYKFLNYMPEPEQVVKYWLNENIIKNWLEMGYSTPEETFNISLHRYNSVSKMNYICIRKMFRSIFNKIPPDELKCEKNVCFHCPDCGKHPEGDLVQYFVYMCQECKIVKFIQGPYIETATVSYYKQTI